MRGVMNGKEWSSKQVKAIKLYAQGKTGVEVSEAIGVIPGTLSRWRRNPQFIEAIIDEAKMALKADIPTLYRSAVKNAEKGSAAHLRIIIEHLDNLEKAKKNTGSITFTWEADEPDQD